MSTNADATMAAAQAAPIPEAQAAAPPPAVAGSSDDAGAIHRIAAAVHHVIGTPPREPGTKRQHVDATASAASEPWVVKREGDMSVNVNAVFAKVLARVELMEQKHRDLKTTVEDNSSRIDAITVKGQRDDGDLGPLACARHEIMATIGEMAERVEAMEGQTRTVIVDQKAENDRIHEVLGQRTLELDAKLAQMQSTMSAQVAQMKVDLAKDSGTISSAGHATTALDGARTERLENRFAHERPH